MYCLEMYMSSMEYGGNAEINSELTLKIIAD